MRRTDLHLKVQVEHDEHERPEDLAAQICRAIEKMYGVRFAELSTIVSQD